MRQTKTLTISLALLFIAIAVAWGSGQEDQAAAEEPVTLKLLRMGTQDIWVNYVRDFIARYEDRYPNVTIDYEYVAPPDLPQKLNVAVAGGTPPDVVGGAIMHVALYAANGVYMPLNDYFDEWSGFDDVSQSMLNVSLYEGLYYGLAYHPDPYVWAYRKDYFRDAGLDPDNPPDTWAELAAVAPQLTMRDGSIVTRAGYLMPINDFLTFVPLAVMNGARFLDDEEQPTFNGPEWIEALEFMTDLYKENVSIDTMMAQEWSSSAFAKGNAAIAQVSSAMLAQFFAAYPDKVNEVGYFTLHKDDVTMTTSNWNGAWLYSMTSASKNKDQAWSFIEEWMSPEEVWAAYQATGNVPVLRSLRDQFTAVNPELNDALFKGVETGLGAPLVTWAPTLFRYLESAMGEAYYGEKVPAQALTDNYAALLDEIEKAK